MSTSLKDRLIRHMKDGHYEPQSKSELARALNVDSRQRLDLRNLVDQLEEEGMLVRLQKGKYARKGSGAIWYRAKSVSCVPVKFFSSPRREIPQRRPWAGIWIPFRSWNSNPNG